MPAAWRGVLGLALSSDAKINATEPVDSSPLVNRYKEKKELTRREKGGLLGMYSWQAFCLITLACLDMQGLNEGSGNTDMFVEACTTGMVFACSVPFGARGDLSCIVQYG